MARFQSRDRFAEGEASKLSLLNGRPLRDEREPELTPAQKKVLKREYKKAAARMSGGVGSGWRRQAVVHVTIAGVGRAEPAWEVGREPLEAAGQLDPLAAKAGRLPRLWPSSLVAAGAFATCFAVVVIGRPGDRPASSADALTATVVATLPTLEVRRAAISRTPADNQLPAAILPRQPTPRVADGTDVGASRDGRIAILAVPLPPARPRNIGAEARPMVQRASLSQFPPPRPEP